MLKGASNLISRCRPFIYCENDRPEKSFELISMLKKMGYKVYEHISHVFNYPNFNNQPKSPFDKKFVCINVIALPIESKLNLNLKEL